MTDQAPPEEGQRCANPVSHVLMAKARLSSHSVFLVLMSSVPPTSGSPCPSTTDAYQVVVPMLRPQHARHLLQAVQIGVLRAARREGHSNDALSDVGEVQLMAVFHGGARNQQPEERSSVSHSGRKGHHPWSQERGQIPWTNWVPVTDILSLED